MLRRAAIHCIIVVCTAGATFGLGSTIASANTAGAGSIRYRDTGFDPNDRSYRDPDIHATTRKVSVGRGGRSWLFVRFRTFDYLVGPSRVRVYLDARGGLSADARMRFNDDGLGRALCWFQRRPGTEWLRGEHREKPSAKAAWCRVPLRWVQPTKEIRWKLFSPKNLESHSSIDEYAPDHGWYG